MAAFHTNMTGSDSEPFNRRGSITGTAEVFPVVGQGFAWQSKNRSIDTTEYMMDFSEVTDNSALGKPVVALQANHCAVSIWKV